jgi:hypothetical protein
MFMEHSRDNDELIHITRTLANNDFQCFRWVGVVCCARKYLVDFHVMSSMIYQLMCFSEIRENYHCSNSISNLVHSGRSIYRCLKALKRANKPNRSPSDSVDIFTALLGYRVTRSLGSPLLTCKVTGKRRNWFQTD